MIVDIIDNIKVADAHFRMILNADSLAREVQPGQFVHLRCRDKFYYDPLLRRPFSIHRFNRDRGEVQILYKVIGKGTSWLAERGNGHK